MAQTDRQHKGTVAISRLTAVDPVVLRQVAELMIVAWSRQPIEAEIEQRVARLEETLRKANPDQDALFVAQRAGRVVGFGRARRDEADAHQWLLFALVVHPEHRRQGIAGALARARIEYAKQRGARSVRSETHIENVASIRYHEAMGFRRGDVFVAPDGDQLVPFRLELG